MRAGESVILFLSYLVPHGVHREWQGVVVGVNRHGAACRTKSLLRIFVASLCQVDFVKHLRDNFFREAGLCNGKALQGRCPRSPEM